MKRSLHRRVLVDSGFWIALLDERDQHHQQAKTNVGLLRNAVYIVPWPTLYETLNTRLMRRPGLVNRFAKEFLRRSNARILDDQPYRDAALEDILSGENLGKRNFSLVDSVLRHIILDPNVEVNYLFTPNVVDFSDVCQKRYVEIIS